MKYYVEYKDVNGNRGNSIVIANSVLDAHRIVARKPIVKGIFFTVPARSVNV